MIHRKGRQEREENARTFSEPIDDALDAVLDQSDILAHEEAHSMPPELDPLP
jgi:hypothetical protein